MMIVNGEFVRDTELDVKNGRLVSESYFGAVPGREIMFWFNTCLWVGIVERADYLWGVDDAPKCVIYIKNLWCEYDGREE